MSGNISEISTPFLEQISGGVVAGLHVDLIPYAVDGLQHPSTVFFFNGVKVVQNSGNGGRGNACASCNFDKVQ